MRYLLDLAYLCLLVAVSPWLIYTSWRHGKYRQGLAEKLLGRVPHRTGQRPCVWFHAVSVGELILLKPLLERMGDKFSGWDCVISTTTQTGFETARQRYPTHEVFYCPLDFSFAVEQAMRRVRPDLLVLSELELWPNLISAAQRHGAKAAIINGRLSQSSYRGYRRVAWLIRRTLKRLDLIIAQSDTYADRFRQLGARADRVHVAGSLKFDGAQTDRGNPATQRLAKLAGIGAEDVVMVAGSTQAPEEALALQAYRALVEEHPKLRLILVPRHPQRFEQVAELLQKAKVEWQRRSTIESDVSSSARILLVDTVGELAAWWGTAQIAYVGGSMGSREGQNMIEPAAYAAAVSFGPRTANFRDVVQRMLDREAAVVVHNGAELARFVRWCLEESDKAAQMGHRAQQLVCEQQGAVGQTMGHLCGLAASDPPTQPSERTSGQVGAATSAHDRHAA